MSVIKQLPNLLTLGNLFCGCLGVVEAFNGNLTGACYLIWLAAILDFLDGYVARLVGNASPFGKQLDSLADVITFGLLPASIMFLLIQARVEIPGLAYIGFLIALLSAVRLAKFNIDTTQSDSFKGLPVPANAILISSLPFILGPSPGWLTKVLDHGPVLIAITILFSLLLVAPVRLLAFKFKDYSWDTNKLKFLFLGLSVVLLVFLQYNAIPVVILLYIFTSILENQRLKMAS